MRRQFSIDRPAVSLESMWTDGLEPRRSVTVERCASKRRWAQIVEHRDLPIVRVVEVWQSLHDLQPISWCRDHGEGSKLLRDPGGSELECAADQITEKRTYCKRIDLGDGRTNPRIESIRDRSEFRTGRGIFDQDLRITQKIVHDQDRRVLVA